MKNLNENTLPLIDIVSYAQNQEDIVLYRAFKNKPTGTYVDLGAGHPSYGSVTKNLAHRLHWKGVEVEANKSLCELLRKQRPRSKIFNIAVSDKEGLELFIESPDNWAMSALASSADKNQFMKESVTNSMEIETLTLNSILDKAKIDPNFEVLKVDIEGAEVKVFDNFDFDCWKPKVIITEIVTPHDFSKRNELQKLIESKGYTHCLFDGLNSFFTLSTEKELVESLSVPANVHDRYIPLTWWNLLPEDIKRNYPEIIKDCESF